jgi:hypothetical protein
MTSRTNYFLLVVCLLGACTEEKRTTPSVECSTANPCASPAECVAGHCVIADAGTSVPDANTPVPPPCIGPRQGATTGLDCVCPSDCDADEICADELSTFVPGGVCLRNCALTPGCPDGFSCIELTEGDPATSTCLRDCVAASDCPQGEVCQEMGAQLQLECFSLCQADADCPTWDECDPYTGSCSLAYRAAGSADIGDPCDRDSDCISDICIFDPILPGGYCTAYCSIERQGCPKGSLCTRNWSAVGDLGVCYARCASANDCRAGYQCGSYPDSDINVCAPL